MTNISEEWKYIDLEFYLKYQDFNTKYLKEDDYKFMRLAYLENKSVDEIRTSPIILLNSYLERWKFLTEDILDIAIEEQEPYFEINNKTYFIQKNFEMLSFEQWQHLDEILKASEQDNNFYKNIHLLLSIVSFQRIDYDYDKAVELSQLLLKEKVYYLAQAIGFFLSNEQQLLIDTTSYLKIIANQELMKAEAMLNKLLTSIKVGGGIPFLKRWQIMIYVSMMRFYLKRFKKSLQI